MRYILILLLVLNAIMFGWVMTHPVSEQKRSMPPVPEGVAQLHLLSEREAADEPESTEVVEQAPEPVEDTAPVDAPVVRHCYTLGPLLSEKAIRKLESSVGGMGYEVQTRAIEQQEISGYWVFLPPYDSRAKALEIAAELARKGIKDYYVVTDKENRNAISLGLFSDKGRANRRMAYIRTLGYSPRKLVRYRDRTYYWLDYTESSDQPLPEEVWIDLGSSKQKVQRLDRSCD
jgi:hypothetical protein